MLHRTIMAVAVLAVMAAATEAQAKNTWEKFYVAAEPSRTGQALPVTEPPEEIRVGATSNECTAEMWARGYRLIGASGFVASKTDYGGLLKFGAKLHARYVCVHSRFDRTAHGTHLGTTGGDGSFTGTVNGQPVRGSYNDRHLTAVPYAIDQYETAAAFFAPAARSGLGILTQPVPDAQKQDIGANAGLTILSVRRGSPAFDLDILPNDILLSINGRKVYDTDSRDAAFEAAKGTDAELLIYRRGERLTKTVHVSPTGEW